MKIKMIANELVDGEIEYVSLVANGANRSPWKIIKAEEPKLNLWAGLMPELEKLEKRLANTETKVEKTVTISNTTPFAKTEPVQKTEDDAIRKQDIAKLRHRLSGLYEQQQNLWERPNTPAFQKFDDELTFAIEKSESELRVLRSGDELIDRSSAFFFRGGTSSRSNATLSDSAYEQRDAAVRKTESEIDLSPIATQADFDRINKIDEDDDFDLETLVL